MSVTSSGMGLGYPAITTQLLSREDAELALTPSQISWFASVTSIACPLGGPISGFLSEKIGRRSTLMVVSVIAIVSWALIGTSSRDNADAFFIQLLFGRALIGVCIGMITTPAVTYSSEVCHQKIRGRLTVLSTPFFVAFGTLVAYLLGYLIPVSFLNIFQSSFIKTIDLTDKFQTRSFDWRWHNSRHYIDIMFGS